MKIERGNYGGLFLTFLFIFRGIFVDAISYDYTAITDCLAEPLKPQYDGGIIVNPEINDGLKGWTTHGGVKIEPRVSEKGNNFIVAHSRKHHNGSVSQKGFLLEKEKLYTFSAWIQITGKRNMPVMVIFKTSEGFKPAGSVVAQVGCWSMLKGGITVESSGPAELFFQSNDTSIDILVDSVSLQPFTQQEWKSHQDQSIEKVRKNKVRLQVLNSKGRAIPYANISIKQNKANFPLGASINYNIVNNAAYQNWFTSKFTVTTFENEMKWYSTENTPGKEDYSAADAMLGFTSRHGIPVRGHNIFWDDPKYQPAWVKNLSPNDLQIASNKRLNSIVTRYAGKVIAWDVNNENLHFNFFESKLGENTTDVFFQKTQQLDGRTTLFINDYNTIEDERDPSSSPSKYIQKLKEIQSFVGGAISLGIGLEGHFITPNIPYVRSAIDTLASTKLPIWITELDVQGGSNQVTYFEQILREVHSHPGIQGIVIWGPWSPQGQCYKMCLVDPNFQNMPAGEVLDKLLGEWQHYKTFYATTDSNGFFNISLFHGDYEVKFLQQLHNTLEEQSSSYISQSFKVDAHSRDQTFKIIAQEF
ncbi:endo-1,4-beta-xylanase 5 [Beta vulgaris subsp. vulgaris]|uniref:endo-1,4-beta-xylanase 5 n=1 Tax=Beta vulgaris subsp. vulgaris TaxID=3555 RepID=UPI002547E61F|nr:endo-1,4-beta-xylanase 5 [Beta vulgaris subsp. vulgaris]